jgi:hypothetical protein
MQQRAWSSERGVFEGDKGEKLKWYLHGGEDDVLWMSLPL